MLARLLDKIRKAPSAFAKSESGNVLMVVGLALPVLLGIAGLGIEGASWYNTRREMQNAADNAAIAAASNADTNFQAEARAVASQYGFTNGAANTVVTAAENVTCPGGGGSTDCWSVTITRDVPLAFSKVAGYTGTDSVMVGGANAIRLTTTAIATQSLTEREYCILALGNGNVLAVDFLTNGAPNADLAGCAVASNTSMTCNGHDLNATFGDAAGVNNGCGNNQNSNMPTVDDPYDQFALNIPTDTTCGGSFPGATWSTDQTLTGVVTICGTLTLGADVNLSGAGQIVIRNGNLDLNGFQLRTVANASATLIFSGTNGAGINHKIVDDRNGNQGSGLEIEAPTSGTWSGIAIYYDPALNQNVDMEFGGNEPYFKITGAVYMPNSDVLFSGAINKAGDGADCFVFVVQTIRINGTANIAARGGCGAAGLPMPEATVSGRGRLVD